MYNKTPIFDRRSIFFSFMTLLLFIGIAVLILQVTRRGECPADKGILTDKEQRALANKLKGVGLPKEAAEAFEQYLKTAGISEKERSNIAYNIGQLYMEAKEYEKALPWLYRVEIFDPKTKLASSVSSQIITCLERLGKHAAAEYALHARTSLDPNSISEETKGSEIVAEIGDEKIYLNEINSALDDLLPFLKEDFSDIEKKREFARHYIAEELLFRKGVKLDYLNDPEVRKRIEHLKRQIVIDQIRKRDIEDKMVIDEEDVKNYFLAHINQYKDPNKEEPPPFEDIKDRVFNEYRMKKIQQGYQELIQQSLTGTDVKLYLERVR